MAWAVLANGGAAPGLGPTGNDDVGLPSASRAQAWVMASSPAQHWLSSVQAATRSGQPGTQGGQAGRVAIGPQGIAQNERIHRLDRHPPHAAASG